MKKIKIVLLSVILGLLLCACGEEEQQTVLQENRSMNAGLVATSYAIPTLEALAQDPEYLGAPYTDLNYDELETIISSYMRFSVDGYAFATAVDSFQKGLAETGSIVSMGQPVVTVDGSELIVDVDVVCERRNANVEMIFTNDFFNPVMTSAAFNVEYTMAEKMSKAGLNTVIGMGTVFVMLIVISFIISLFGVFSGGNKKPDKTEEGINRAVKQIEENETAELAGDSELVAVIAAAIAAYEGSGDTSGFTVRSVRKIKR